MKVSNISVLVLTIKV